MKLRRWSLVYLLFVGFSAAAPAQLAESFTIISAPGQAAAAGIEAYLGEQCAAADLLLLQGCFGEAAAAYNVQLEKFIQEGNQAGIDRACSGLYRAQLLAKSTGLYADSLARCRPEIIDPLLGKADGEPMFITHPVFEPNPQWLDSAVPGVNYKVTAQFDIDEFGRADNFNFNADDKNLLRYPVFQALKNARYLPGVQEGKPVKKSKNVVEVIFCLDRGTTCVGNK
ncbi:MAG: hypothetical protein KA218_02675 [Arenimonas sp.]|nr:hypothetical protein [Arenimonas sp.]MBP7981936.1 hypothetical protein [Arenimonas sp.]